MIALLISVAVAQSKKQLGAKANNNKSSQRGSNESGVGQWDTRGLLPGDRPAQAIGLHLVHLSGRRSRK
jgi:hypothetical protein